MGINLKRQNTSGTITSEAFEPFSEIAVSLSGGGFRAAAYTLGCLSYLQRRKYENVRLLERVKFITGASGGALTGILFSAHNHLGIPFSTTYARLRQDILMEDKILQEAVKVIADDKQWPRESLKRRNTINAFAKVYQKMVFDDLNFGLYWDKTKATVDEVCFSASELENGRTFRFQTDGKDETKEMIGNPYLRLTDKNTVGAKKMLLGDILAASSCAPGGFEPMIFPGDFATNREHLKDLEDTLVAAKNHDWEHYESFKRSFALMDGGITDNQGVEGLKLAHKRRKETKGKGYDLTLICDVANYFLDPYLPLKEETSWWSRISLYDIIRAHKYASLIFVLSLIMVFTSTLPGLGWVLATVSGIMFSIFLAVQYMIGKSAAQEMTLEKNTGVLRPGFGNVSPFHLPFNVFLNFFLQSPLSRMGLMLKARIGSAMRVAMDIYVLQIRRINYESLAMDPDWWFKIKAVSIYELSKSNQNVLEREFLRKELDADTIAMLSPSEKIMGVAEYARQMGTTLWFSKEDANKERNILEALVACGQFTMCYNLLEYVIQLEKEFTEVRGDKGIQQLKVELIADWKKFQDDPRFMVIDIEAIS